VLVGLTLFTPFVLTDALYQTAQSGKFFYFEILTALLFPIFVFLLTLYPETRKFFRSRITQLVIAFTLVSIISGIFGIDPWSSFGNDVARLMGWFFQIHVLLFYCYLSVVFLFSEQAKTYFLQLLVAISAPLSLLAVLESKKIIPSLGNMFLPRASSVFDNPIYFASFLILPFFFALTLASKESGKKRMIYWIYAFCIFLGIFFTFTRGALLGLVCGLLVYLFLTLKNSKRGKKVLALIVFATIGFGFFFLLPSQSAPVNKASERLLYFRDASAMDRFIYWKIGVLGWMDKPLLGLGPENYSYAYAKYFDPQLDYQGVFNNKPHNQFVEVLTTTGLAGFFLTIAIYLFALKQLLTIHDPKVRKFGIAALTAYAIQNFFIFDTISSLLVFYGFLAWITISPLEYKGKKQQATLPRILLPLSSLVGVGCILFFILLPSAQEFMDLATSKHDNLSLSEQADLLNQSLNRSYVYSYSAIGERIIAIHLASASGIQYFSAEQIYDLQQLDQVGIKAFDAAIKQSPNHLKNLFHRGFLTYQSALLANDPVPDIAIHEIERALNLSPKRPELSLLLDQLIEHNKKK